MACCYGTVSYYECYPTACPSDDYCCCDYPCSGCCRYNSCGGALGTGPYCGGSCTSGCSGGCTSTCGKGACCTCNRNQHGFALAPGTSGACYWNVLCGTTLWFAGANCSPIVSATRRDYNGTPSRMADLAPALFTALGHDLAEGLFETAMSDTSSFNCICP